MCFITFLSKGGRTQKDGGTTVFKGRTNLAENYTLDSNTVAFSRMFWNFSEQLFGIYSVKHKKERYSIIISNYQGANPGVFGGQSQVYKTGQKVLVHNSLYERYTADIQKYGKFITYLYTTVGKQIKKTELL